MNDSTTVNILGAGGHSRSVIALLRSLSFEILGIYDDSYDENSNEKICQVPILGKKIDYPCHSILALAIGDNNKRKVWYEKLNVQNLTQNLVHPTATIIDKYKIGNANMIFAKALVNTQAKIGNNNIINSGAILEHEVVLGNHNHISVGAILCGRVQIGDQCFVGAGAVIIDNIKIGNDVIIGANSVVISDIVKPGVYVGNPARKLKNG